jgi:hypothetical protein
VKLNDLLYHRKELSKNVIDMRFIYSSYVKLIDFYISKRHPHVNIAEESAKEYENQKKIKLEKYKELE